MTASAPAPRLRPTAVPGDHRGHAWPRLLGRRPRRLRNVPKRPRRCPARARAMRWWSARRGRAWPRSSRTPAAAPVTRSSFLLLLLPCVPGSCARAATSVRVAAVCPRRLVRHGRRRVAAGARGRARGLTIPTHVVRGLAAPVADLAAALPRPGVAFVEDAAHAVGAEVDGQTGRLRAAAAVHSFGKGKHVNTVFGGLVVTDDAVGGAPPCAWRWRCRRRAADARSSVLGGNRLGVAAATRPASVPARAASTDPRLRARSGVDLPTLCCSRTTGSSGRDGNPGSPPDAWGAAWCWRQLVGFPAERERRRALAGGVARQDAASTRPPPSGGEQHPAIIRCS